MIEIKENKIPDWNEIVELSEAQYSTTENEEVLIPYEEADQKLVLLAVNSGGSDATLTVKPGDMPMSGNDDYIITVPAGKEIAAAFESGRYKKNDGYIHIISSANTIGFQLIAMP